MSRKYLIIVSLILMSFVVSLYAQDIDYKLDRPAKLYVGTPFNILIDITTELNDSIFTVIPDTLDIFILKDLISSEKKLDTNLITHFKYTFQPFNTGEYTFPILDFLIKTDDGTVTLQTSEFQLNIETVLPDSASVVKDIADPITINPGVWDFLLPILLLALLVVGIYYLTRFIKNKPEQDDIVPEIVDTRAPYLIALEMLEQMKRRNFLKIGDFLSYYFRLSFILRFFVERQFRISAVEMTTTEIRKNLITDEFNEKTEIMEFLQFADKVKFAKYIPDMKKARKATSWLEQYLISYENKIAISEKPENLEDTDA